MTRSRFLRRAWAVAEFLCQVVLLAALLFVVTGALYVFFGGSQ